MLFRTVRHLHTGEDHLVHDDAPTVDLQVDWNRGSVFARRTWRDAEGRPWAELEFRDVAGHLCRAQERVRPVGERAIDEPCLVSGAGDVAADSTRTFWPCTIVT